MTCPNCGIPGVGIQDGPAQPVAIMCDLSGLGADFEILCDSTDNFFIGVWDGTTDPPTMVYYSPDATGTLNPYTPTGSIQNCVPTEIDAIKQCWTSVADDTVAPNEYLEGDVLNQITFFEVETQNIVAVVWRNNTQGTTLTAPPEMSDLELCAGGDDNEFQVLCDDDGAGTLTPFLRRYIVDPAGTVTFSDTGLSGLTPYVVAGTVAICQPSIDDYEIAILCDNDGAGTKTQFLRTFGVDSAGVITATDTELDGLTPYVFTGTLELCEPTKKWTQVLCDIELDNTVTQFQRCYESKDAVVTYSDLDFEGMPYVVQGVPRKECCLYNASTLRLFDSEADPANPTVTAFAYLTDPTGKFDTVTIGGDTTPQNWPAIGPWNLRGLAGQNFVTITLPAPQVDTTFARFRLLLTDFDGPNQEVLEINPQPDAVSLGVTQVGTTISSDNADIPKWVEWVVAPTSITVQRTDGSGLTTGVYPGELDVIGECGEPDSVTWTETLCEEIENPDLIIWNRGNRFQTWDIITGAQTNQVIGLGIYDLWAYDYSRNLALCHSAQSDHWAWVNVRTFTIFPFSEFTQPPGVTYTGSAYHIDSDTHYAIDGNTSELYIVNADTEVIVSAGTISGLATGFADITFWQGFLYVMVNDGVDTFLYRVNNLISLTATLVQTYTGKVLESIATDLAGDRLIAGFDGNFITEMSLSGTLTNLWTSGPTPAPLAFEVVNYPPIQRVVRVNTLTGNSLVVRDFTPNGVPYIPFGELGPCPGDRSEQEVLCDDGTPFLRYYAADIDGLLVATDTELDGVTEYVVTGTVSRCTDSLVKAWTDILCDDGVTFIRCFVDDGAGGFTVTDLTLAGAPYTVTGTVGRCVDATSDKTWAEVLCDDGTPFIRCYVSSGAVVTTTDLTLAGAAYTVLGTVGLCVESAITLNTITPLCYEWNDAGTIRQVVGYAKLDDLDEFEEWVVISGVAPPDLTIAGALVPCEAEANIPYSQEYTGVAAAVLPVAGLVHSLTLSVYEDSVTVTTPTGSGFVARTGSSFTWGNSGDELLDLTGFSFVGNDATADYVIHGEQ